MITKVYRLDTLKQYEFPLISIKIPEGTIIRVLRGNIIVDDKICRDEYINKLCKPIQEYILRTEDILEVLCTIHYDTINAFYIKLQNPITTLYYHWHTLNKLKIEMWELGIDINTACNSYLILKYEELKKIETDIKDRDNKNVPRYFFTDADGEEVIFELSILYVGKIRMKSYATIDGVKTLNHFYVTIDNKNYRVEIKKQNRKLVPFLRNELKLGEDVVVLGVIKNIINPIPNDIKFITLLYDKSKNLL